MDDHRPDPRLCHDLAHLLRRGYAVGHHGCSYSLCHLCLRAALAHAHRRHFEQRYRRCHQSHPRQDAGCFWPASGISLLHFPRYGRAYHDGCGNNVEAYAAAQVFYTVGNNGIQYSLSIFLADTSSLRNRGLMQAFASSPNLITCWLAGPISSAHLKGPGWRWCFGSFTIIMPAITLPLFGLFVYNYYKAKKQGLVPERASQRRSWQSFLYYCREFDAFGLILLSAGVALFLLPFNLYTLQAKGWRSSLAICLLVFGIVLMIVFAVWERSFTPVTFIPYSLLLDRTAFGTCILSATLFVSFYCWNSYFRSFLQVVNGPSVTDASYVV